MRKMDKETMEHFIKNHPYMTYRQAAEMTDRSVRTIYNWVYGIRDEIIAGRYPAYVLPGNLISWYALVDYMTYKNDLMDKYRRKTVPPFDPELIAVLSGLTMKKYF